MFDTNMVYVYNVYYLCVYFSQRDVFCIFYFVCAHVEILPAFWFLTKYKSVRRAVACFGGKAARVLLCWCLFGREGEGVCEACFGVEVKCGVVSGAMIASFVCECVHTQRWFCLLAVAT